MTGRPGHCRRVPQWVTSPAWTCGRWSIFLQSWTTAASTERPRPSTLPHSRTCRPIPCRCGSRASVATEFVGDDHPWHVLQPLAAAGIEAPRGCGWTGPKQADRMLPASIHNGGGGSRSSWGVGTKYMTSPTGVRQTFLAPRVVSLIEGLPDPHRPPHAERVACHPAHRGGARTRRRFASRSRRPRGGFTAEKARRDNETTPGKSSALPQRRRFSMGRRKGLCPLVCPSRG